MPRVEVLTEASGRDPEAVLTKHVPSEMLADEHYAEQLLELTGWALVDAERQAQGGSQPTMAARLRPLRLARCAVRRRGARAIDVQPHAAVKETPRRASSASSPSTREAPLVISLRG